MYQWKYLISKKKPRLSDVLVGHNLFNYIHSVLLLNRGFTKRNYKKGALDSQPHVIKFTSCLPMVDGSLRVLRLLPPLKLVDII